MISNAKKRFPLRLILLVAATVAALCLHLPPARAQKSSNEASGTIVGTFFGSIIGGAIGGRAGSALVGGLAGAAIGGLIGNRIGAQLDEQERLALARATRSAFTSGRAHSFSARSGVHGRASVVSTSDTYGKTCRTVKQEVTLKNGSVLNGTVSACRGANGRWEI